MEEVKALRVFHFYDPTREMKLRLYYGRCHDHGNIRSENRYQRWMIRGRYNPMPVRNGTWFSGMAATEMIEWFCEHGYVLQAIVDMHGNCTIMPNTNTVASETDSVDDSDKVCLVTCAKRLYNGDRSKIYAIKLLRLAGFSDSILDADRWLRENSYDPAAMP